MARITKDVLAQIEAKYVDVGYRQQYHQYGAVARIDVKAGGRGWLLYVSPSRADRPIEDAIRAIIRETKVGKQILKKATRHMKLAKAQAREAKLQSRRVNKVAQGA